MKQIAIRNNCSFILVLLAVIVTCINLFLPTIFDSFKYTILAVSLGVSLCLLLLNWTNIWKKEADLLAGAVFAILLFLVGHFLGDESSILKWGSFLLLLNFLFLILTLNVLTFSKKQINFILSLIMIYAVCFLIKYFTFGFGNINPNTIASFSFPLFIYAMIFSMAYHMPRIILVFISISFMAFAYFCQCRSVLIGEIAFIVLLNFKPLLQNKLIFNTILGFFTFGSILFTQIWVWCYNHFIYFKIPLIEKSLYTGRETIWAEFTRLFSEMPFLGIGLGTLPLPGNMYEDFTPHNSMLNILVSYGIISFLICIYIIFRTINSKGNYLNNPISATAMAGLLALFVSAFFETILISYIHLFLIWFLLAVINSIAQEEDYDY